MTQPEAGWVTPAKVVDVHDGDTITVEVTRQFRVRLLDCWAPEIRGGTPETRNAGERSTNALESLLADPNITIFVPTHVHGADGVVRVQDMLTLGRVLGRAWTADGRDVSETMVQTGFATATKDGK